MRAAKALIDLTAVRHNLQQIKTFSPQSQIMAVVKADAYGHGLVPVARALTDADALAVACLEEATQIREGGVDNRIVLLEGFFSNDELPVIERHDFDIVVHSFRQIECLANYQAKRPFRIWLKVDSGMHRLGFQMEEFAAAYRQLSELECVAKPIRLMSHFACADDIDHPLNHQQLKSFSSLVSDLDNPRSMANSAGILAWPESHFDWVRPGLLLFGCSPLEKKSGALHGLLPAMNLESEVFAIQAVKAGETVGYGAGWTAENDTRIGIVAIGYGDGYPRWAKNGTPVWVNGKNYPLAGRVSMDMIAIDLGHDDSVSAGDRAVLWGKELPVEIIAEHADTIPYTLLCAVTNRVKFSWL